MAAGFWIVASALIVASLGGAAVGAGIAQSHHPAPVREGVERPSSLPTPSMAGMDMSTMEMDAHGHMHMGATPWIPSGLDLQDPPDLSHEPPFALENGILPTYEQAQAFTHKYSRFVAKGDAGLDKIRAQGYLSGKGTPLDPYILENFYVSDTLSITSTNRSIILRNGYVDGQLKLDYVGSSLYVHHVYADDLRVNENVVRDQPNTGGLFEHDRFGFVGQIRHFVGEFRFNEVGPKPANVVTNYLGDAGATPLASDVVFNFDGFHDADVHDNHFVGMVDIKLHGHNHGDCFTCEVHDHALDPGTSEHDQAVPANPYGFETHHSIRYTSLLFRDNTIEVRGGVALRYNDRNHAGDDRTATSEPDPHLDNPHVHFQDVTLRGNKLVGGSLFIDVFNAADPRHPIQDVGILRVWDNDILVDYAAPTGTQAASSVAGLRVATADGLQLSLARNTVRFAQTNAQDPGAQVAASLGRRAELRGIQLDGVDASNLTVSGNKVPEGDLGVFAKSLSASTFWWLQGNLFDTKVAWRGQDVAHPPEEQP